MADYDLPTAVLICAAIGHAEGFWDPGAMPRRHNNPGDLLDSTGENRQYSSRRDGFAALLNEVVLMLTGRSHVYKPEMTWLAIAHLWTGGDNELGWCAAVCADLGVLPDSTLGDFVWPTSPAPDQVAAQAPPAAPPTSAS